MKTLMLVGATALILSTSLATMAASASVVTTEPVVTFTIQYPVSDLSPAPSTQPGMFSQQNSFLRDGVPTLIEWDWKKAPSNTVAEIVLMSYNGSTAIFGVPIGANPATKPKGKYLWMPRINRPDIVPLITSQRLIVSWKTNGVEAALSKSAPFRIIAQGPRGFIPTSFDIMPDGSSAMLGWTSQGIPASAHIIWVLQSTDDPERGPAVTQASDTGSALWYIPPGQVAGNYILYIMYVNEEGAFATASNIGFYISLVSGRPGYAKANTDNQLFITRKKAVNEEKLETLMTK